MIKTLSSHLASLTKPGRYLGNEYHSTIPSSQDGRLSWVLAFPDLYEIGMSHQGLQILYHLLNGSAHGRAERCYCPAPDAEALLRTINGELCSIESDRPLRDFDIVGFTLPHELCYTNILTMLDLAKIPFRASLRDNEQPIVLAGGPCAFNPEPIAECFDAILLGDGEEAVCECSEKVSSLKQQGASRQEIIDALADIEGMYLPHRYRPVYMTSGKLLRIDRASKTPNRVRRRILGDIDRIDHLLRPIVPNARIIHDRLGIEIARGCTRSCRFCQAGITYRPVRERSTDQICTLAEHGITSSGFDEIALLSLSTGDYSCLPEVLPRLMNRYAELRVSLSMPSMRVGTLSPKLMAQIKRVRKTGFTLAPEAGSERLRQTINKGITEHDLLDAVQHAFALGWNLIKLYFMVGLPGETTEDVDAIADLARKTARAAKIAGSGRRRVNISVGTFVPKPHTPFQWEPQLTISQSRERIGRLRSAISGSNLNLKYHDPEQSFLEGIFSRGDRRLLPVIITAWERGARLDSWSEHFDLERWRAAAVSCDIDIDSYLLARETSEILPWDHLDPGVDRDFLLRERDRAGKLEYTPDCRYHACQQCGVCDFKTIRPVVRNRRLETLQTQPTSGGSASPRQPSPDSGHKYLIEYQRTGKICFLGHLELMQVIIRSIRRAGLLPNFTKGFNPTPKISFGPALPVGTESLCEWFIIELRDPLDEPASQTHRFNEVSPPGITITGISPHHGRMVQETISTYHIVLASELHREEIDKIEAVTNAKSFVIERHRKGTSTSIDLRPLINRLSVDPPRTVIAELAYRSGSPGCKPLELIANILPDRHVTLSEARVRKIAWRPAGQ